MSIHTQYTAEDHATTVKSDISQNELPRDEYYESLGKAFVEQEAFSEAIENFRLARLHNAKRASSYILAAEVYKIKDQKQLAADELTEGLKVNPDDREILMSLGQLYLEDKVYSKASQIFNEVSKLYPNDEEAQLALFFTSKLEGRFEEALELISRLENNHKTDSAVLYEKAVVLKKLGQSNAYQNKIEQAYLLNPRQKLILTEYVSSCFDQQKFKSAVEAMKKYLDVEPFSEDISLTMAYAAIQNSNFDLALQQYDKIMEQNGVRSDLLVKKAHLTFLKKDFVAAEAQYKKLISDYRLPEARYYLGQTYLMQDKHAEAYHEFSEIDYQSDFYGSARSQMAQYKIQQNQLSEARVILKNSAAKKPKSIEILKTYADFLLRLHDTAEAQVVLDMANEFFPNDSELKIKSAFVYYQLGKENSYKEQVLAAIKLDKKNAGVYLLLNEAWELRNKKSAAVITFYKKAEELKNKKANIRPLLEWILMERHYSTEAVTLFEELYEKNPAEVFYVQALAKIYDNAEIKIKAKQFNDTRIVLETNENFRLKLEAESKTAKKSEIGEKSENQRMPASLQER